MILSASVVAIATLIGSAISADGSITANLDSMKAGQVIAESFSQAVRTDDAIAIQSPQLTVRERYAETGDADQAVIHGIAATGRIITGVALIVVVVFAGFAAGAAGHVPADGLRCRRRPARRRDPHPDGGYFRFDVAARSLELVISHMVELATRAARRGRPRSPTRCRRLSQGQRSRGSSAGDAGPARGRRPRKLSTRSALATHAPTAALGCSGSRQRSPSPYRPHRHRSGRAASTPAALPSSGGPLRDSSSAPAPPCPISP